MQYELSDPGKEWPFRTQTSLAFIGATGGGIGGYFFGEYARPDPRQLSLIASGGVWGGLSGVAIGAGVTGPNADWKDGGVVVGFVGFATGVAGSGALSLFAMPSYETQKWMWVGYGSGLAAGALVFPFYLFSDSDPKHGFVAVGVGGGAVEALVAAGVEDVFKERLAVERGVAARGGDAFGGESFEEFGAGEIGELGGVVAEHVEMPGAAGGAGGPGGGGDAGDLAELRRTLERRGDDIELFTRALWATAGELHRWILSNSSPDALNSA
jgi:hypothetical protein